MSRNRAARKSRRQIGSAVRRWFAGAVAIVLFAGAFLGATADVARADGGPPHTPAPEDAVTDAVRPDDGLQRSAQSEATVADVARPDDGPPHSVEVEAALPAEAGADDRTQPKAAAAADAGGIPAAAPSPETAAAAVAADAGAVEWIKVAGHRIPTVADPTAFATVVEITDQDIDEFKTVAQVLAETVGVQVRSFGGLGDFSTVSIRGSTAAQVQIYLDSVPLTRARSGTVNLAHLPLDPLESIEVYRGTTPISVGASALGGVVQLVTRDPGERPTFSLLTGGGSFGTRKASMTGSAGDGDTGWLVSTTYFGSEGDFPYPDDNGTPLNPHDDAEKRRESNAFNWGDAIFKVVQEVSPETQLVALAEVFSNAEQVAGLGSLDRPTGASLFDLRQLDYLRLDMADVAGTGIASDATLWFVYEQERFDDPLGRVGLGVQDTNNRNFAPGFALHGARQEAIHLLEARMDLSGEIFLPRDDARPSPVGPTQSRFLLDLAAGDTLALLDDALLLDAQARFELAADDFAGDPAALRPLPIEPKGGTFDLFTPRLGASWQTAEGLWLKANAGRYGRVPTFTELFGNRGTVIGNPALVPEEGINVDAGLEARLWDVGFIEALHLEPVFFWRDVDDLILLRRNSQSAATFVNIGRAEITGVEIAGSAAAEWGTRLVVAWTWQDARNHTGARDGRQLPGLAQSSGYVRLDQAIGPVLPYYELTFDSGNFLDEDNFLEVAPRQIHTVGMEWSLPGQGLTFTVEVANLTDDQVADVAGFPLPGLSVLGTLAWRWEAQA